MLTASGEWPGMPELDGMLGTSREAAREQIVASAQGLRVHCTCAAKRPWAKLLVAAGSTRRRRHVAIEAAQAKAAQM